MRGWPEVELAVIGTVPLLYKTESGELGELTVMVSARAFTVTVVVGAVPGAA